jgi:hypothetical protein
MEIGRRTLLKVLGALPLLAAGISGMWQRIAFAAAPRTLALRKVTTSDAAYLEAIMNSCVSDVDAFHGKCNPWSRTWAEKLVSTCAETPIIEMNGIPVAFIEIPPIRPALSGPPADASPEELRAYELAEEGRRKFRVTSAGVRADLLSEEDAKKMFFRVLYYGAKEAQRIGYRTVEAFAPWDRHPTIQKRWDSYPGCEIVNRSRNQKTGEYLYLLRWNLDDMVATLAAEGADDENLDS